MTTHTSDPTEKLLAASEAYDESLRKWSKVHVDYQRGEAGREDDLNAWDERQQAFADLKRLEAELSDPRAGSA